MASGSCSETTQHANALNALGLFRGTGAGYELDKIPTRIQGLVMLIRLLGEENSALESSASHSFTDVPEWADKYVGYAIEKGYTKGIGTSTFSPDTNLDAKSYVTFVLRAIGYSDSNGDFSWSSALSDSADFRLMTKEAASALAYATFNRGDMVDISYCALTMTLKDSNRTLAQKLISSSVFTTEQGNASGVLGSRIIYTYVPYDNSTIEYCKKHILWLQAK